MRLADIKDESRFGVLDEATAIIEKLSKNEVFKAMMFKDDLNFQTDAETAKQVLNNRVLGNLPKLMKSAKSDLIAYFACVEGISEEEYTKDMTLGKIFNGVIEMLNDPIFLNFFYSYQTPSAEKS